LKNKLEEKIKMFVLEREKEKRKGMLKIKVTILATLFFISIFGIFAAEAVSPIKNPDTLIYTKIGETRTLDPAWAYDTASMEVVSNCYETLIAFDGEKFDSFLPELAEKVPKLQKTLKKDGISLDGLTYRFRLKSDVKFANGYPLTPEDVEYTFERIMVHDKARGPAWLFLEPLVGVFSTRDSSGNIFVDFEDIDNAVKVEGNYVEFHLVRPFPPFLQILAEGWSSIVSKQWCYEHGDWDGTETTWKEFNNPSDSPLHAETMGSAPFQLETWTPGEITLIKSKSYWNTDIEDKGLKKVIIKSIYDWNIRKQMLIAGDADFCDVPSIYYPELDGIEGIRVHKDLESLTYFGSTFNFDIPTESPYIGTGSLGEGIPSNFFSDINIRKAFAYAFDYERYINEIWLGEAEQPTSPVIKSLPFHNPDQLRYEFNPVLSKAHFQQAFGGEVWNQGFKFTIIYYEGVVYRQTIAEWFKSCIESLNPTKFHIELQVVDFDAYWDAHYSRYLPIYILGWAADYPDPHNFIHPFMHSLGFFTELMGYSDPLVDALIGQGIDTLDPSQRQAIYYELQSIYYSEALGIPHLQPLKRHYERDWVHGWVYNPIAMTDFSKIWKK
jgi:peptide/nickel transport system substrate-binding protein